MTATILYFPFRPRLVSPTGTPAQDLDRALASIGRGRAYDPYRRERDAKLLAGALKRIADRPSDTEPPGAA